MKYINDGQNNVPDNTISIMGYKKDKSFDVIKDMKGESFRKGFPKTASACLPMSLANQIGFCIVSLSDFTLRWDGGDSLDSIKIYSKDVVKEGFYGHGESNVYGNEKQKIAPFYSGMISIVHDFFIRTPPGVNILVTSVPNNFIPGVVAVSALIETDNLGRDWVFNLKVTVPNIDIEIKKGDPLIMLMPVERFYPDSFELKNAYNIFDKEVLINALNEAIDLSKTIKPFVDEAGGPLNINKNSKSEIFSGMYALGKGPNNKKYFKHQKRIGKKDESA